jgi:LmbE family N-acetylglucosaminyl deacetylase
MKKIAVITIALLVSILLSAQQNIPSSEILLKLKKLNKIGTVLYLAAHPDDENTRLISYLANGENLRTGYLSLTRGDGGQNLIGTEKGEYIGLLRTQELLEARKIDGGEQFFTRAVDFGYSKTSKETLEKWNEEEVLSDIVWVIRNFKPNVIVLRFPPNSRAGHGHHTASAILAEKAFDLAADPNAYPEQLNNVQAWQVQSLYFNTSTWWDKTIPEQAKDNADFISIDIGTYNNLKGMWHNEISSVSRSSHKSQGFGTSKARGSQKEYLKYVKGDKKKVLFTEEETSWATIKEGKEISDIIDSVVKNFDVLNPSKNIAEMVNIYSQIETLNFDQKEQKLKETQEIIQNMLGLFLEANTTSEYAVEGDSAETRIKLLNPSEMAFSWDSFVFEKVTIDVNKEVSNNQEIIVNHKFKVQNKKLSQPYWLWENFENMFVVSESNKIGVPENTAAYNVLAKVTINGKSFSFDIPVNFKKSDRVKGELIVDFKVYPKVALTPMVENVILSDDHPKFVSVKVRSFSQNQKVTVSAIAPRNIRILPFLHELTFEKTGMEKVVTFEVSALSESADEKILFEAIVDNKKYNRGYKTIEYDHITKQVLFPKSEVNLKKVDLKSDVNNIAYVMGAGDEIPDNLREVGFNVTILTPNEIVTSSLESFDAILGGIRVLNTQKEMEFCKPILLEYVKNGGTLIYQYNTNRGVKTEGLGPYPFTLSRQRVTDEYAKPTLLAPDHKIMNFPNKLTLVDFDNWVQERGLYFPGTWDEQYTPLIAWSDPDEEKSKGSVIVADYEKGAFIYTGISFFRQLPKGVPGAYKLLVNMINYKPTVGKQ